MAQVTNTKRAAAVSAAVALLCSTGAVTYYEGREYFAYRDINNVATVCDGDTNDVQFGHKYSDSECDARLKASLLRHGMGLSNCLTREIPTKTQAALTMWAYNVGVANACNSTLVRKANAGDIAGACAQLDRWTYVGGKDCKLASSKCGGIVKRRAFERSLCEKGLRNE